jgi:predicted enzyme related to lactoylglutathione lyase
VVKDIAFSAYPAKNVEELRSFYTEALGFQFSGPFAEDGVLKYDEAKVGNGWFSVMTRDWLQIAPSAGVTFEVDDIEKTAADLRGKGVEVEQIYDTPVCRLTSFNDPEGNKVTLHQVTVPH